MNLWNTLLGSLKREIFDDQLDSEAPEGYRDWVKLSIEVMSIDPATMEFDVLKKSLISRGIPEEEVKDLHLFIPISFARTVYHQATWPAHYIDYFSPRKQVRRKYTSNPRYVIMKEEATLFLDTEPTTDQVLNVVQRSAEYRLIQDLLAEGGEVWHLGFTETLIPRY